MKRLLIGVILVILCGCSTIKTRKPRIIENEKLIGTWRFSGETGSNGFKSYRTKVADSVLKLLIFHQNGKITGNYFRHARYSIIVNSDNGMLAIIFKGKYVSVYDYNFENNELYLSRLPLCDEGCSTIFTKVQ